MYYLPTASAKLLTNGTSTIGVPPNSVAIEGWEIDIGAGVTRVALTTGANAIPIIREYRSKLCNEIFCLYKWTFSSAVLIMCTCLTFGVGCFFLLWYYRREVQRFSDSWHKLLETVLLDASTPTRIVVFKYFFLLDAHLLCRCPWVSEATPPPPPQPPPSLNFFPINHCPTVCFYI